MHRRQAPTGERPSISQSVGMNLPPALAACRMVWPSSALISSPSMRMDSFFCGKAALLSLRYIRNFQIAAKATASLV